MATEPCDLSATEAAAHLRRGDLSATELVTSCLSRADAVDGAVNALVARNDAALVAAQRVDAARAKRTPLGPLAGLPLVVKDIHATGDLVTSYGAAPYANFMAHQDEPLVARLRAGGAIVVAKTNTPELSIGANTVNRLHGATANPFDTERTCGGSSGGSAVALACGMAALATGSDHGGSLRIPATYCGVAAHRSTPGTVAAENRTIAQTFYAVNGPMGRTVADVGLMLSVMASRDDPAQATAAGQPRDPMAFPIDATQFATLSDIDLSQLRIGVSADLGGLVVGGSVRAAFSERVELLARHADVVDVPLDLTDAPAVDWQLRADIMATQFHRMAHKFDDRFNPNIKHTYLTALNATVLDIAKARRRQVELFQHTNDQFADVDVIVCPGVSVPPFPWRELFPSQIDGAAVDNYMAWLGLSASLTVVGHPVTALPAGTQIVSQEAASQEIVSQENASLETVGSGTQSAELPFGVQLVGPLYADHRLLSIAAAIESLFASQPATARPSVDIDALTEMAADEARCAALRTEGKLVAAVEHPN